MEGAEGGSPVSCPSLALPMGDTHEGLLPVESPEPVTK